MTKNWVEYEDLARDLLNLIRTDLKLRSVEGKQRLVGKDSGTEWEVDAKGIADGSDGIIIVEVRRHTNSKLNQEQLGGLAYRIKDTGSQGGIIVSPLGLQEGAKKIADAENIHSVEIDASSTAENFAVKFLNKVFVGVTDRAIITDRTTDTISRKCSTCNSIFESIGTEVTCQYCKES